MDLYNALTTFVQVAELNSFSAAARALDLNAANVTKQIQWLETHLALTLFIRSTRHVVVTDSGEALLVKIKPWLEEFNQITAEIKDEQQEVSGKIIFGGQSNLQAYKPICSWIAHFLQTYPKVSIKTKTSTTPVDVLDSHMDCYLGMDRYLINDSEIIGRTLMTFHHQCYASPSYIDNNPPLNSPEELIHHQCVTFKKMDWELNGKVYRPDAHFNTDIGYSVYRAGTRDIGIIYVPDIFAEEYCQRGTLQRVMPDYRSKRQGAVKIYYPKMTYQPKRVKALIDFFVAKAAAFNQS